MRRFGQTFFTRFNRCSSTDSFHIDFARLESSSKDFVDRSIRALSLGPKTKGPLRCVRTIDDATFVVGMGRQVFYRAGANDWKRFDKGMTPPKETTGFETVNGKSQNDFYAAGWNGEIWHFQKDEWSQLNSPTNRIITDICVGGEDIYMCGQSGTILRKKGKDFELIEIPDFKFDIWRWLGFKAASIYQHSMEFLNTLMRVSIL